VRSAPLVAALLATAAQAEAPARTLVVALDPGHGGPVPHEGAHGRSGLVEKDVALAVAQRVKSALEQAGATVVLTRDGDAEVALTRRAQIANESDADLFLSIHCNSMATRASRKKTQGIETYFLSPEPTDADAKLLAEIENGGPAAVPAQKSGDPVSGILADLALTQARNDSAALAQIVQQRMVRDTGAPDRGVRQAPFAVLSGTKMPSALVEIGFISHPVEGRMLGRERHQQRIAHALAAAVQEYADKVLARRLVADRRSRVVAPEVTLTAPKAAASRSSAPPVAAAARPR
jgi:N-acetylmuramoyl-L-alanine amidase